MTLEQQTRVRDLAEQLDAHRKRQQAQHPELTLTGMYNVLEKLKTGEALSEKERTIHEQDLVSVLKQLHDELDVAVLDAYGWSDLAPLMDVVNGNAPSPRPSPRSRGEGEERGAREEAKRALDEALLDRLVALNAERTAEEQKGLVRWLRPDFQAQAKQKPQTQVEIDTGEKAPAAVAATVGKLPWPKELPARIRLVSQILSAEKIPLTEDAIAARIAGKGPWKKGLPPLVETLVALGRARRVKDGVLGVD